MLNFQTKIDLLEGYLTENSNSYADSFKTDILFYIDELNIDNKKLEFLNKLNSAPDIYKCVDNLTSKIVLKFREDEEQLSDFIYYNFIVE